DTLLITVFFPDLLPSGHYPLSLHDALPICAETGRSGGVGTTASTGRTIGVTGTGAGAAATAAIAGMTGSTGALQRQRLMTGIGRSEEHTSELQSRSELVCRLLLEKKKTILI